MARIVTIDFNEGLLGPNVSDFGGFSQFDFPAGPGTASVESGFGRDGGYGLKIFTNSQEVDDDGFTITTGYIKSSLTDIGVHAHPMRPQAGDDWWYSFSFKIGGSAWSKGKGYEPIIWQARSIDDADGTNTAFNTRIPLIYFSIDDPGTAPLSASDWYRTSTTPKLFLSYLQPNTQGTSTNHYNNYSNFWHYTFLGNLAFETWYDVKFRIVWSASSNGSIQAWLKSASQAHFHNYPNVQIEDIQNIPVVGSETGQNYIKVGYEAYLNNASVNDYMKTTLYFDNILAGNDEEDVDLYTDDDSVISFRTVIYPYEMSSLAEFNTPVVAGGSNSPYILKNAPVNEQVGTNFIKPGTSNQILTTISGTAQWSSTDFITDTLNLYVGTVDTNSQTRDINLNHIFTDMTSVGVLGTAGFKVTERAAGQNLSVDVAPGTAWLRGDGTSYTPTYRIAGIGTSNLAISTAHSTLARKDIVVAQVSTANFYTGSAAWSLAVVTGTPGSAPGTPTTPTNSLLLGVVNVPAGDTTIANAQITDKRYFAQIGAAAPTNRLVVTEMPRNPYDGQIVSFVASEADGILWNFRYNASSSSSYKWEFIGGPPIYKFATAQSESTTSTSYVELSTVVQGTAPLAGDYDFHYQCDMYNTTSTNSLCLTTVQIGSESLGFNPGDAQAAIAGPLALSAEIMAPGRRRATVTNGNTLIKLVHRVTNGQGYFQLRHLWFTPIRVA